MQREFCDIYALPNGSMLLKKSIAMLLSDVFNTTELIYGDVYDTAVGEQLVRKWFPPRSTGARSRDRLVGYFGEVRRFLRDEMVISLSLSTEYRTYRR